MLSTTCSSHDVTGILLTVTFSNFHSLTLFISLTTFLLNLLLITCHYVFLAIFMNITMVHFIQIMCSFSDTITMHMYNSVDSVFIMSIFVYFSSV